MHFVDAVNRIARDLRDIPKKVDDSALVVRDAIRRNMDQAQNAGVFRIEDAGTLPGQGMQGLSKYTLAKRAARGNDSPHPLKDTGGLYASMGIRSSKPLRAVVGARGALARKKLRAQLGTDMTGIVSSDLQQPIPPRNPVGYSQSDWEKVKEIWAIFDDRSGIHDRLTIGVAL